MSGGPPGDQWKEYIPLYLIAAGTKPATSQLLSEVNVQPNLKKIFKNINFQLSLTIAAVGCRLEQWSERRETCNVQPNLIFFKHKLSIVTQLLTSGTEIVPAARVVDLSRL